MAVTVSYSFETVGSDFFLPDYADGNGWTEVDLATRADGGIVAVGNHGGVTEFDIYDSALDTPAQGDQTYAGIGPSVAEFSDGTLVAVSVLPDFVNFSLVQADGTTIATSFGFTAVEGATFVAADVTTTGDTAVAAVEVQRDGDDSAISLDFYTDAHLLKTIDTDGNDTAPSICTLTDGGIAVAWTVVDGAGHTAVWNAIYEANGDVRAAPEALDNFGDVNRDVSVVALADGSFYVAYEDSDFEVGKNHIAIAHIGANNAVIGAGYFDVTPSENATASQPSLTLLSNGFVAVSYTLDYGGGDEDIRVRVVDPTTDTVLDAFGDVEVDGHNSHDSSIAGLNQGSMVVAWTDDTDGNQAHQYDLVRTTTGAHRGVNNLTGDSLIDSITGGIKDDTLDGGANDDQLYGGIGNDTLIGGAGADGLYGGTGINTASYAGAADGVTADLTTPTNNLGDAAGDTYAGIDNVIGSAFDDILEGNDHRNVLDGDSGSDALAGHDGNDVLKGGGGLDILNGGAGADRMSGGTGHDQFDYFTASESSGHSHDIIKGVNFAQDAFVLPVAITATEPEQFGGQLDEATFNTDLADAMRMVLGANEAVLFKPDTGSYANHLILVIDLNAKDGYQSNKDLVIDVTGASQLGAFGVDNFLHVGGREPLQAQAAFELAVLPVPADVMHALSHFAAHGGSVAHEMFF